MHVTFDGRGAPIGVIITTAFSQSKETMVNAVSQCYSDVVTYETRTSRKSILSF